MANATSNLVLYRNALKAKNRFPIAQIEWTDENSNVIRQVIGDVISGNISMSYKNGIRRTINLTLQNITGDYIPKGRYGLIWYNNGFKLRTGLRIDGTDYFVNQGVYVLGNPTLEHDFANNTISFTAYDKFATLDGTTNGALIDIYSFPVGSNFSTLIRQIFLDAGITTPVNINPYFDSVTTPYTITVDWNSTYGTMLVDKLCTPFSQMVYFDRNGIPTLNNPVLQNSAPVVWDFRANKKDETLYIKGKVTYDFAGTYNYVKVIGDTENGDTFIGIAQDDDPLSDTYVNNIGLKPMPVLRDENIYNNNLANLRATHELNKAKQTYKTIVIECVPIDLLQEGDIITVTDEKLDLDNERCIINQIDSPLTHDGIMTINCTATRNNVDIVLL